MRHQEAHDIIIVSDLHLSAVSRPRTSTLNREQDSPLDAAFAGFLDYLWERAIKENRKLRLVILGDLFDFLKVEGKLPGDDGSPVDTSEEATLAKLDRIAESHPKVFEALGRFVAAAFPLDIVPGNHDIELIRQSAQEQFKKLVLRFSARSGADVSIRFHPWIYHEPGVLYAEHGHQYHDINSFTTLLRPSLARNPKQIDLPLGSYFERYLSDVFESIGPVGLHLSPTPRYLLRSLPTHPKKVLTRPGDHVRFLRVLLSYAINSFSFKQAARRAAYREEVLRPCAAELGLRYQTLVAIDQLSALSAISMGRRLLRKFFFEPVLRALRGFADTALSLSRSEARLSRLATLPSGYLHQASLAIHNLLQAENKAVPYYVFGHTHAAEQLPLILDSPTPCYLNCGSWTPVVPSALGGSSSSHRFTFVQITREPEVTTPVARLLVWNNSEGRPRSL